jgi:threonylcarbamoyladenosine tRNA methylthiotransferase MtaB
VIPQDFMLYQFLLMNSQNKPIFIIKTLGCKVNQYESQIMREELIKTGFEETSNERDAFYAIINSCTVTGKADKETRNLINGIHNKNPKCKIAVVGCYAESDKDRRTLLKIPGITFILKNSEKLNIAKIFNPSLAISGTERKGINSFKNHERIFIKIQDGCNHQCSYCKVRLVRGRSKSRREEDVLEEIKNVVTKGYQEIVLTGICLGAWGRDLDNKQSLSGLLDKIVNLNGNFRIRLSSIEPIYITHELLDTMNKHKKICKHLHIPLQSGDKSVLKLMKRPYNVKQFLAIIRTSRRKIKNLAITTDVIVGFPGEKNKNFINTLKTIELIKPSRIHVFSYSKREGTEAYHYEDIIDKDTKKKRVFLVKSLGDKISKEFAKKFIGKTVDVIIENTRDRKTNLLTGYSGEYVRVMIDGPDNLKNSTQKVKISHIDNVLYGVIDPNLL